MDTRGHDGMVDARTREHMREFYEYAGVRFLCTPCAYLVRAAYKHFDDLKYGGIYADQAFQNTP